MMGKNHITCSSFMTLTMYSAHICFDNLHRGVTDTFYGINPSSLSIFQKLDATLWNYLGIQNTFSALNITKAMVFFIAMIFGTLLTDCDSKKSILGRWIYIPVEHRTWLHAIWIPTLLALSAAKFQLAAWLALGLLMHEFMDSFSYEGNSYLYPIVGYRHFGNSNTKIKKGIHNFKLYRANEKSEKIFTACVVVICILLIVMFTMSPHFHFDFVGDDINHDFLNKWPFYNDQITY